MPTDADLARDPAVLSAEQAATTAADIDSLPAAGDARREEMLRRADGLTQAAERLRDSVGIHNADPKAFQVENEIGQFTEGGMDGSEVSDALDDYVYHWEQADIRNTFGNLWVTQAKSIGWEVVGGDMPEAKERRFVDGTRRWGDTILMRMRRERANALEIVDRRRRLARSEGISLRVLEEADRLGVAAYDITDPKAPAHIRARFAEAQKASAEAARTTMVSTMRQAGRNQRAMAGSLADQKLDRAIRAGNVPNMPAPRA